MIESDTAIGTHEAHFPVAAVFERRPADSPWVDHLWTASGIAVGRHADHDETRLLREEGKTAFFLVGGLQVRLYKDECESYYHNLVSDSPRAFVLAHPSDLDDRDMPQAFLVSMSFDEAHAYLEGDDEIYAVDIPPELYRWTEAFVLANYFPEKKRKRKLRDWAAEQERGPKA